MSYLSSSSFKYFVYSDSLDKKTQTPFRQYKTLVKKLTWFLLFLYSLCTFNYFSEFERGLSFPELGGLSFLGLSFPELGGLSFLVK